MSMREKPQTRMDTDSPGRAREQPRISLSNSISRRLRSNGSMKGGQASPMFPTNDKKRGCAFENSEPSSPKVTCIGQVRVKTKKQGKKMRTRSSSRRRAGEVSFRRLERSINGNDNNGEAMGVSGHQFQQHECLPHRNPNQRWVHLPLTICEALRAFGAELNCILPCRSSSCLATDDNKENRNKEEKEAAAVAAGGGDRAMEAPVDRCLLGGWWR